MSLTITSIQNDDVVRVEVSGEVDVSCASELREALDTSLGEGARTIEVDISEMSYIDSTGIGVLVGFAHRAEEASARLFVLNPQRNVARVLALLGVDKQLGVSFQGEEN